jgi:hypothetical protein
MLFAISLISYASFGDHVITSIWADLDGQPIKSPLFSSLGKMYWMKNP